MADNKVLVKAPYGTTERMVQEFLVAKKGWITKHLVGGLQSGSSHPDGGSCAAKLIKPVFDEFHEWLLEIKPKVPPTLMFGRAINYALSAWNHLLNYLDYPELFVDNSIAERSIKPFVIGRKNWLFSGSETGAESSCFLFTLIENAKLYKLDPYEYLRCIFDQAGTILRI